MSPDVAGVNKKNLRRVEVQGSASVLSTKSLLLIHSPAGSRCRASGAADSPAVWLWHLWLGLCGADRGSPPPGLFSRPALWAGVSPEGFKVPAASFHGQLLHKTHSQCEVHEGFCSTGPTNTGM